MLFSDCRAVSLAGAHSICTPPLLPTTPKDCIQPPQKFLLCPPERKSEIVKLITPVMEKADGLLLAIRLSFQGIVYLTDIGLHLQIPFYCPAPDEMLDYNGPLLNPASHII